MNRLLTATALLALSPACFAGEPTLAVCRVTGNTKGPPRVAVATTHEEAAQLALALPADAKTAPQSDFLPAVVEKLPACVPAPQPTPSS